MVMDGAISQMGVLTLCFMVKRNPTEKKSGDVSLSASKIKRNPPTNTPTLPSFFLFLSFWTKNGKQKNLFYFIIDWIFPLFSYLAEQNEAFALW
jgi:hypothetical protein